MIRFKHCVDDANLGLYCFGTNNKMTENVLFEEDGKYHRSIVTEEHISVVNSHLLLPH